MKKKVWNVIIAFFGLLLLSSFLISKDVYPSPDTRVVLEHSYKSYIAPACFETADATNYLEESTLSIAQELEYKAHSLCTEEALEAEENSLFISILKELGIIDKKWDW